MRVLSFVVASLIMMTAFSPDAFAFNQDECGNLFPKVSDKHPPYLSPFYTVTMIPSTTSYMSSWGKCSMYGSMPVVQRRKYVASTYESLVRDAARGEGEYVHTLASLSGCPSSQYREFSRAVKDRFNDIFNQPETPDAVTRQIDAVIEGNKDLSRHCLRIR